MSASIYVVYCWIFRRVGGGFGGFEPPFAGHWWTTKNTQSLFSIHSDTYRLLKYTKCFTKLDVSCKVSRSKSLSAPVPQLRCLCTESSVKRQFILNTHHLGPPPPPPNRIPCPSSFETPFVKYGTPVKEITSMAGLFSRHIILGH